MPSLIWSSVIHVPMLRTKQLHLMMFKVVRVGVLPENILFSKTNFNGTYKAEIKFRLKAIDRVYSRIKVQRTFGQNHRKLYVPCT